jgi:hypothetical protein
VVAQSNNSLNNIASFSTGAVSETARTQGIAEARFMRGLAYWYISSLWGCAVIYENTQDLVNNYVVAPARQTDHYRTLRRHQHCHRHEPRHP